MIFTQYDFKKIEAYTQDYNTIIYLKEKKSLYLIKDDIKGIDTYKTNNIMDNFFVIYSKKWFNENNTEENLKSVINSKNMIQAHMKREILQCFQVATNIVNDLTILKTQNHIIANINRYLSIYNLVKRHIDNILRLTLPKTHYAGALTTKTRKVFDKNLNSKNCIKLIMSNFDKLLIPLNNQYSNMTLWHEIVSHFKSFCEKFLKELEKSNPQKLTSTKLLREQKTEIINYIVNKILKTNDITNINLRQNTEASKYFANIIRLLKYNNILYSKYKITLKNEAQVIQTLDEISEYINAPIISPFTQKDEIELSF